MSDECTDYRLITADPSHVSMEDQDRSTRPLGVISSDPLVSQDARLTTLSKVCQTTDDGNSR
jgi:hypothetical protein